MKKVQYVTIYEGIADQPAQGVLMPNGQVLILADDSIRSVQRHGAQRRVLHQS